MTLDCDQALSFLLERPDGTLAADDRARLDRHLEACRSCHDEANALETSRAALRQFGPVAPRRDLWQGINTRIAGTSPAPAGLLQRLADLLPRPLAPRLAFGVAILAVGIVLGILMSKKLTTGPTPVPTAPLMMAQASPQSTIFQTAPGLGAVAVQHDGPSAINTPKP